LKAVLLESGVVDEGTFTSARDEAKRLGLTISDVLIGRGTITEEYLLEQLEQSLQIPVVDLRQKTLDQASLELIPEDYAKTHGVILFEHDSTKKIAKLAMLDPLDFETIEFLRAKLGVWAEAYFTSTTSFKYGLRHYHKKFGAEYGQVIAENVQKFLSVSGETDLGKLAEAVPLITILDSVIEQGIGLNASDIHFEPFADELLIRYRIDGVLVESFNMHKALEPILVARVKILANMRVDEHTAPQDGRFKFELDDGGMIDIRVSVMPVMHGERVEMRLLKNAARPLTLEELGLSEGNIAIIQEEMTRPHGLLLVTGPTGHGKTTTLYTILHLLNTSKVNIMTIEDPIEYEIPRVNQTQVNVKGNITFASGLRAHLRQNPDIIMVGEIRDSETVEISIHSALTGHLVLSTLHTNDAPSALPRLLDMGAPPFLLASTVNVVIAQRLVRKICSSCIESYPTPPEMKRTIEKELTRNHEQVKRLPDTLYRGRGCNVCNQSGFQGQTGIYEIFRVSDAIRELLLKLVPVRDLRNQAVKEGMVTMFQDGLQKVERGQTTIEEVIRVVEE
jgi:type IV pilus assembly protein PilB